MSRTAITLKFKMFWLPNEARWWWWFFSFGFEKAVTSGENDLLVFISSHVTAIVTSYMMSKYGIREKIKKRSIKNLIIVFYIEFYDFC